MQLVFSQSPKRYLIINIKKRDVHFAHLFYLFSQKVFSVSYPNIFKKSTSFSVKNRNLARGKSFLVKPAKATLSNFITS